MLYVKYEENTEMVQRYFDALFLFPNISALEALRGFTERKGFVVDDYQECWFMEEYAEECTDWEEKDGVVFDFSQPLVEEDLRMILSCEEFYGLVKAQYQQYVIQHGEEKDEVMELLNSIP